MGLKICNQLFLGKWLRRLGCEREKRWRVLSAKYGCSWGKCTSLEVTSPYGWSSGEELKGFEQLLELSNGGDWSSSRIILSVAKKDCRFLPDNISSVC